MKKLVAILSIWLTLCGPCWVTRCQAIERNVASQYLELFAFDASTNAPKTGDAANLTAYVTIDGDATEDPLTDTSATEIDATNLPGWYRWDLAQGETNGASILYGGKSSTANVKVVGRAIHTTPANFSLGVIAADGMFTADVDEWNNTDVPAEDTAGYPKVTIKDGTGTGELDTSSGLLPWNPAWDTEVESEATDALNAYDPPTRTEATADKNEILNVTKRYNNVLHVGSGQTYTTVQAGVTAASAGDKVLVHPGAYTPGASDNLLKNGVDIEFMRGATVTCSAAISGSRYMFDDGGAAVKAHIYGHGVFAQGSTTSDNSDIGLLKQTHASSVIVFEADEVTLTDSDSSDDITHVAFCSNGFQSIKLRKCSAAGLGAVTCSGGRQEVRIEELSGYDNVVTCGGSGVQIVDAKTIADSGEGHSVSLGGNGARQFVRAQEIGGGHDIINTSTISSNGCQVVLVDRIRNNNGGGIFHGGTNVYQLVRFGLATSEEYGAYVAGDASGGLLRLEGGKMIAADECVEFQDGASTTRVELAGGSYDGDPAFGEDGGAARTVYAYGPVSFSDAVGTGITIAQDNSKQGMLSDTNIADILTDTGTSGVVLANDAITASKYDESTAFPLTSADTSTTRVARTGADSDTLETLSDGIDGISAGTSPTVLVPETTITVTNQTTIVLTDGPPDNDALNGHTAKLVDQSNADQFDAVQISDYVGSTKTVTLARAPVFTIATNDLCTVIAAPAATVSGTVDANMVSIDPELEGTLDDAYAGSQMEADIASRASQTSVDDVPTVSEFNARTLAAASYATASALQIVDDFVDDLETRVTALRAGYLDNLSAGAAATAAGQSSQTTILNKLDAAFASSGVFSSAALENAPTGSGDSAWSSQDVQQARYRLGIDGTTDTPDAEPNLGIGVDGGGLTSDEHDWLEATKDRVTVALPSSGPGSGVGLATSANITTSQAALVAEHDATQTATTAIAAAVTTIDGLIDLVKATVDVNLDAKVSEVGGATLTDPQVEDLAVGSPGTELEFAL